MQHPHRRPEENESRLCHVSVLRQHSGVDKRQKSWRPAEKWEEPQAAAHSISCLLPAAAGALPSVGKRACCHVEAWTSVRPISTAWRQASGSPHRAAGQIRRSPACLRRREDERWDLGSCLVCWLIGNEISLVAAADIWDFPLLCHITQIICSTSEQKHPDIGWISMCHRLWQRHDVSKLDCTFDASLWYFC